MHGTRKGLANLSALGMGDLKCFLDSLSVNIRAVNLFPEHFSVQFDLLLRPVDET